jgi:hypothetical protein
MRQTLRTLIHDNRLMNRERLDAEGYIVSEADLGNVQPDFEGVPKTAAELLLAEFGSRLHSGYVYGSVVRGNAVPRRSDVDVVAVLKAAPTNQDRGAARRVAQAIQERCPVLLGAGVGLTHVDEVLSAEERYGGQVFLRELSVCICGEDLRPGLPRTKPGPAVAAGFHRDTHASCAATWPWRREPARTSRWTGEPRWRNSTGSPRRSPSSISPPISRIPATPNHRRQSGKA